MRKFFVPVFSALAVACLAIAAVLVFPADAEVVQNEKIPIAGVFGGCIEPVILEGTDHVALSLTADGNGGLHGNIHVNTHVSGVGAFSGGKYVGNGKLHDNINIGPGLTQTIELAFKLVGQGALPNLTLRETFKCTINANGEVTVLRVSAEFECK